MKFPPWWGYEYFLELHNSHLITKDYLRCDCLKNKERQYFSSQTPLDVMCSTINSRHKDIKARRNTKLREQY